MEWDTVVDLLWNLGQRLHKLNFFHAPSARVTSIENNVRSAKDAGSELLGILNRLNSSQHLKETAATIVRLCAESIDQIQTETDSMSRW